MTDSKGHILAQYNDISKSKFTFVTENYDTFEICFITKMPLRKWILFFFIMISRFFAINFTSQYVICGCYNRNEVKANVKISDYFFISGQATNRTSKCEWIRNEKSIVSSFLLSCRRDRAGTVKWRTSMSLLVSVVALKSVFLVTWIQSASYQAFLTVFSEFHSFLHINNFYVTMYSHLN